MTAHHNPRRRFARYRAGLVQFARANVTDVEFNVAQEPAIGTMRQLIHHGVDGAALWTPPVRVPSALATLL